MPPLPFEYQGRDMVGHFLHAVSFRDGRQRSRLIPTRANGQPAFGRYLRDPHAPVHHAHGLIVLTLAGDSICAITGFNDNSVLARFGLPAPSPNRPSRPLRRRIGFHLMGCVAGHACFNRRS